MADYQELIKNFERIRDYMRQFFVYGFKVRSDFDGKSARTYDNERRRVESMMADYTHFEYTPKGKKVYVTADGKTLQKNPLYAAWKSKSFTDNDIMLHFYLPDLLMDFPEGLTAGEASEQISLRYGMAFDSQTVRLKLKEYEALGLFAGEKSGKELKYHLVSEPKPAWPVQNRLLTAIAFYREAAPFGFVGDTILDAKDTNPSETSCLFQFKHHFIVHTLEDGVLCEILAAMQEHREISFENHSHKTGSHVLFSGVPLKIFVSTQTGRRYLCLYLPERSRFHCARLDSISKVQKLAAVPGYDSLIEKLSRNLPSCFGVSFGGNSRKEELYLRLYIDEDSEDYIIERLRREGRGGEFMRIRKNEYLYSGRFFDTNEMLSWVKSFTGRILDIQGSNPFCMKKVTDDWEKMYHYYCEEER